MRLTLTPTLSTVPRREHAYKRVAEEDYGLGTFSVDLYDLAGHDARRVLRVHDANDYQIVRNTEDPDLAAPAWLGLFGRWGAYEQQVEHPNFFGAVDYTYEEVTAGPGRDWD